MKYEFADGSRWRESQKGFEIYIGGGGKVSGAVSYSYQSCEHGPTGGFLVV